MLNQYNEQHPEVEVTLLRPDEDIYQAVLSLPDMTMLCQKQTKAVKEVPFHQQV